MAQQVRGVVARSKGAPVSIETIVVPDPGPGEAVVTVQACGVCHTDLHYREGGINDDFPFLLGHEAAGVVESVGEGVTNVVPGDFVILNWRAVCGTCRSCLRGRPWLCFSTFNATQKMTLTDGTVLSPALGIGAFVEKTLVAAGQCTKVDPGVPATTAGLLGCGVMAGIGAAINTGNVGRGDSVAVFGCGGVGDAAIAGARLAGAHTIIAVDIDDRKLEWAKEFGATHTCNSRNADPVEYIKSVTGGNGADVCIEAIGNPAVYRQAFEARDLAGTVVLVGVPRPDMTLELAVHRGVRPRRLIEVVVVRRLPALARLSDARHPAPARSPPARQVRQRDDLARRRRGGVPQDGAWRSAAQRRGPVTIELVTTDGIFALDGGQWAVTNNIWLVGDDREVVVLRCRARRRGHHPSRQRSAGEIDHAHSRPQRSHQRCRAAARGRRCAGVAARRRPHAVGRRVADCPNPTAS